MNTDYTSHTIFIGLLDVIEEYTDWFIRVTSFVVFADGQDMGEDIAPPHVFNDWCDSLCEENDMNDTIKKLSRLSDDCLSVGAELVKHALQIDHELDAKAYNRFKILFEEFAS